MFKHSLSCHGEPETSPAFGHSHSLLAREGEANRDKWCGYYHLSAWRMTWLLSAEGVTNDVTIIISELLYLLYSGTRKADIFLGNWDSGMCWPSALRWRLLRREHFLRRRNRQEDSQGGKRSISDAFKLELVANGKGRQGRQLTSLMLDCEGCRTINWSKKY